jgi:protein ImuA
MQLISCHDGRLLTLEAARFSACRGGFRTGLEPLDALAPGGSFARGAVHELLCDPAHGTPSFVAMLLARGAARADGPLAASPINTPSSPDSPHPLIWSDPHRTIYPPALALHGIPLTQLILLRTSLDDQIWAVAECLRCKGVGAVIASIPALSRVEARRLQLAAETGGGVAVLLRPAGRGSQMYAAATRWLVKPAPGERTTQRWTIQLIHGHGGRLGQAVILEYCRENHLVRAVEMLADRSDQKATPVVARAS